MQNNQIAVFITATGNYIHFVSKLIISAEKYFLPNHKKTYFIFSEREPMYFSGLASAGPQIVAIPVKHSEWPKSTINRCKFYSDYLVYQKSWLKTDYSHFFAIDADAYFTAIVEDNILSNLIAVEHCAYINRPGEFETNTTSECYVNNDKKDHKYYGGGFYGGDFLNFGGMNLSMDTMLDLDFKNGIIPIWHDESALNKFFSLHKPTTTLSPSFHWPEYGEKDELNPYIARIWQEQAQYIYKNYRIEPPFPPILKLIDKIKGDPQAVAKLRNTVNNF